MTEPEAIPVLLVDDRPENLTLLEALPDNMGLALFKATSLVFSREGFSVWII
jgi:hypothetical protein